MKIRRMFAFSVVAILCLSMLCVSAAATTDTNDVIKSETLGVVVVQGEGKYDFGDGTLLTIEPIPWLIDEGADETAKAEPSEVETVKVQVDGEGRYDLGNGAILIVEPISEEEMGISPLLNESNSSFPLTNEWTWFCSDDPILKPVLKVYNNSKKNPGNLNVQVGFLQWPLSYEVYGIEPGMMGKIENIPNDWYTVYLSASVNGNYNVKVTDWP